ncbi:MAG: sensor histidine kinase [Edaphobacter sp.]
MVRSRLLPCGVGFFNTRKMMQNYSESVDFIRRRAILTNPQQRVKKVAEKQSRREHSIRLPALPFLIPMVLCLLLGSEAHAASSQPPDAFRTAASILALPLEQIRHPYPALLDGVVTQSTDFGLTIADRTGGIWIYWNRPGDFTPGDHVEIRGVVEPGLFAPTVRASSIRKLGRAPLPKPMAVTLRQLNTGREDCQYVSVVGTVRSVGLRRSASRAQRILMKIAMNNGFVKATFPVEDSLLNAHLVDALVRIRAVAMCTKNRNRQITAATLSVSGMSNLTVLRPAPPDLFARPLTPISRLMQYRSDTDYDHRVRIAGTVTYYEPGASIILEEKGKALFITTTEAGELHFGDHVEAAGFLAPRDSGPILEDAVLRRIAPGHPLQPTTVRIADIGAGTLNYNLISTEGQVVRRVREPSREVLLLQDGAAIVLAELDQTKASSNIRDLEEGSRVRVTGISVLEVEGTWNYGASGASAIRYKLLLRSSKDVEVVRPPSWWTARHTFYIAAILAVLALAFLCQVIYSRVKQWRVEAVHEERERLAHEIHDTLAQSFAGIGFQLQAIRKAIPHEIPRLQKQVDLACELVRHSHTEARRSLGPPPQDSYEEVDLLPFLQQSARKMVEDGPVEVSTSESGSPRPLSPQIADTLLRIGQESIANAVRHADPDRIQISLHWDENTVRLIIEDDGIGFVKHGELLGFGLRGMRKRAAAIGAKLEIESQPGEGTRVEVTAMLPPNLNLMTLLKHSWIYVSERVFRVE